MENKRVSELLDEIAALVSVEDFPTARFEVRAYQKAALTIGTLQEPIEDIYRKGGTAALMELPGVGKSIASAIEEYIKTGKMKKYEMLKKKYPIDMAALTAIQGLGAKRAVILYRKLGIKNVDDLKKAIAAHKIAGLEGFGEKSEESLRKGLEFMQAGGKRVIIMEALPVAEDLVKRLLESGLAERAMVAGSARRMRETVGDLDLLVVSNNAAAVMDFFGKLADVQSILVKGPTKTSVRLKMGLQCDLRVVAPASYGAAKQYFTGSRDHNIQVRKIAISKGYKLNEYGLFDKRGRNAAATEEGIYEKLGMQIMAPEMREARGEVELALKHQIPPLVELGDIRGDLHTHTKETDGADSLEEMAFAAMKLGYQYIGSTEHTKSTPIAKGKDDKGFERILRNIDKLNDKLEADGKKFRVLKGAECDINKDGSLDLDRKTLEQMDCVVGSVHNNVRMAATEMSNRIIKALDTGLVHILGHPTGRIVNERAPYEVDLESVAESAERNGVALEVNSTARLDLNDTNIMLASKYRKLMFSINTDSHRTHDFMLIRYGIGMARRGWLGPGRVINTMELRDLLKWLAR